MMRTLLLLAILLSVSCKPEPEPAPPATSAQTNTAPAKNLRALPADKQLLAYYEAMASGRVHDAYEMVHEPDRKAKSLDEFRMAANDQLQMKLLSKRTYTVKDVKIDGKVARVDIDTTGPDVAKLQKLVIPQLMALGGQKPTAEMLKGGMMRALDSEDVPMVVTNNTLYLAQNDAGEWKLDFDWDKERVGREVPMKRKIEPDAGAE